MRTREPGFVLIYVVTALALVGVAMSVLGGTTDTMLFQTDTALLEAVERDLVASGLAWAREQLSRRREAAVGEVFEPDTTAFGATTSRLRVTITNVGQDVALVRLETACTKGRRTLTNAHHYEVPIP